jgi:hypothetical protein
MPRPDDPVRDAQPAAVSDHQLGHRAMRHASCPTHAGRLCRHESFDSLELGSLASPRPDQHIVVPDDEGLDPLQSKR